MHWEVNLSNHHMTENISLSLSLSLSLSRTAIDDDCQLTQPLGYNMAEFPLTPMFARMLLTSGLWYTHTYLLKHLFGVLLDTFGCSEEAVTIAAMLQVHHVFNQSSRQKAAAVSQTTSPHCPFISPPLTHTLSLSHTHTHTHTLTGDCQEEVQCVRRRSLDPAQHLQCLHQGMAIINHLSHHTRTMLFAAIVPQGLKMVSTAFPQLQG